MARRRETPWTPPPAEYPGRVKCRRCSWHYGRPYVDASGLCWECWLGDVMPERHIAEPKPPAERVYFPTPFIDTLPPRQQRAATLYNEGLPLRQIGRHMGITAQGASDLIDKARRKLAEAGLGASAGVIESTADEAAAEGGPASPATPSPAPAFVPAVQPARETAKSKTKDVTRSARRRGRRATV